MVAESSQMTFEKLLSSIESEFSRRKKRGSDRTDKPTPSASADSRAKRAPSTSNNVISKKKDKKCWSCSHKRHFEKDCWFQADRSINNVNGGSGNLRGRVTSFGRARGNFGTARGGCGFGGRGTGNHNGPNGERKEHASQL